MGILYFCKILHYKWMSIRSLQFFLWKSCKRENSPEHAIFLFFFNFGAKRGSYNPRKANTLARTRPSNLQCWVRTVTHAEWSGTKNLPSLRSARCCDKRITFCFREGKKKNKKCQLCCCEIKYLTSSGVLWKLIATGGYSGSGSDTTNAARRICKLQYNVKSFHISFLVFAEFIYVTLVSPCPFHSTMFVANPSFLKEWQS